VAVTLGMVERLTSAAQSLFPLIVVLALRQTGRVVQSPPALPHPFSFH
jgi:hypothetical protein